MLYFVIEVGEDIGEFEEEVVSLTESTGEHADKSSLMGWAYSKKDEKSQWIWKICT